MKRWIVIVLAFVLHSTAGADAIPEAVGSAEAGRYWILEGEFKRAAHAFEESLRHNEADAALHYWAGMSNVRLAELSTPLTASRFARRARQNLERAVQLEPSNQKYLRELFEFYLDSPEWFGGGVQKAVLLLEQLEPDDPEAHAALQRHLLETRRYTRSVGWKMYILVRWPLNQLGRLGR